MKNETVISILLAVSLAAMSAYGRAVIVPHIVVVPHPHPAPVRVTAPKPPSPRPIPPPKPMPPPPVVKHPAIKAYVPLEPYRCVPVPCYWVWHPVFYVNSYTNHVK